MEVEPGRLIDNTQVVILRAARTARNARTAGLCTNLYKIGRKFGGEMKLEGLAKKLYAEKLRNDLMRRSPEHSDRISSLSDDRIITLDQEHTRLRAEAIRSKFNRMRSRAAGA